MRIFPNPKGSLLAVEGCIWAWPYEVRFYDFSEPMKLPWPQIDRYLDDSDFFEWVDENNAKIGENYEFCTLKNKRESDMTLEESKEVEDIAKANGVNEWSYYKSRSNTINWKKPSSFDSVKKFNKRILSWGKKVVNIEMEKKMIKILQERLTSEETKELKSEGLFIELE